MSLIVFLKKDVLKNRKKYDIIAGVGNMAKAKGTSITISLCSINESSVVCFSDWRFLQTPARIPDPTEKHQSSSWICWLSNSICTATSVQQHLYNNMNNARMAAILSLILYYVVHG